MRPYFALALLCFTPLAAHAAGDIYRWKDEHGIWHYSDQPQPGAEIVKSAPRSSATTNSAPPKPAAKPAANPPAPKNTPPVSDNIAQQVRTEAATAKSEQCQKATADYDKVIQARRLYRVDDQGNQVFLNEAEIDESRLNARAVRDLACEPQ
jgi:hypothetical protein